MTSMMLNRDVMPSPRLETALAAISAYLHPACDVVYPPGYSKGGCILCSHIVRDFLSGVGFIAKVMPVGLVIWATERGVELHSICVGMPALTAPDAIRPERRGWDGHMVVLVHDGGSTPLLIDTTLGQARRPQWPELPTMIASDTIAAGERHKFTLSGHGALAGCDHHDPLRDYKLHIRWFATPRNDVWKGTPDSVRTDKSGIVAALKRTFEGWSQEAAA